MDSLDKAFGTFWDSIYENAESLAKDFCTRGLFTKGGLTKRILKIFDNIDKIEKDRLSVVKNRRTTLKASIFEIFIGELIRNIVEAKKIGIVYAQNSAEPITSNGKTTNKFPDILLTCGERKAFVELKLNIKSKGYSNEKDRRKLFLKKYPGSKYNCLIFSIYDRKLCKEMEKDICKENDWLYILEPRDKAKEYLKTNYMKNPFSSIEKLISDLENYFKTKSA